MANKKTWLWLGTIVALIAFFSLMTLRILREGNIVCDVCMNFSGKAQCSKALAPDQTAALQEARQNLCSELASGVTETLACQRTPPDSSNCKPAE